MIIECKNLSVKYDNGFLLDNVSFSLHAGDYLCILGENGSGKSTLIKTLLGLKKKSGGEVIFNGLKSTHIGYIPQHTAAQKDFPTSVWEVVLSGCLNRHVWLPFYTSSDKKLAMENIKKMNIAQYKNKSYQELSGGQQQRVLLARALCATHKLIILDEPATGLDPMISNELYQILADINKKGTTIIMVSHDIHGAMQNATKILHMGEKEQLFCTKEEYKHSEIGKKMLGGCKNV